MTILFHDELTVVTLGSGSKGNATWIGDGRRGVLIDCGVSTKQIVARMEAAGLADAPIDAVLLTHEHSDHVSAAAVLERRLASRSERPVPFFVTEETLRNMPEQVRPKHVRLVRGGSRVRWDGWTLEAHAVPHDTPAPVAWTVDAEGTRAGVITDLGHAPRLIVELLSTLDVAVVEFNHDDQMLMDGPYPWSLKQRIRGRHGHLSNAAAADLLRAGASPRLAHVVLAHLSQDNNTPDHALQAALSALADVDRASVCVQVAAQGVPSDPIRVGPRTLPLSSGASRPVPRSATPFESGVDQPSLFDSAS